MTTKTTKRLFLIKDIPVFIEAGDETEAIMLFETAMEAVQSRGYENLQEVIQSNIQGEAPDYKQLN